jgi:transposase-like protein
MSKAPTLRQFQDRFPTEESCLDHLMRVRYGERHDCEKCGKSAKFYRVAKRRSYACEWCGYQVYPTAGTPFDRTRTSLRDWFFVMFQFCTSRSGVAAKEVERQIGVTYKTAWRMCHEIRKYMAIVDGNDPLGGSGEVVEIDETLIGGSVSGKGSGYKANKAVVIGMLERGGEVVTKVVTSRHREPMERLVLENVLPGATVATDEFGSYRRLDTLGFDHVTVQHKKGQYTTPNGGGVNAIEGFWSQLKRSINGTHIHVSRQHLSKYLGEFEFRHNRRHRPSTMLDELLTSFVR